jgi:cytochrome c2
MKNFVKFSLLALAIAGCGTVAQPYWAQEAEATRVALVATDQRLTQRAPTATPTTPPTSTPAPSATLTLALPTATPTELPTATLLSPTPTAGLVIATRSPLSSGDPEKGLEYFNTFRTEVNFACATCHYVDKEDRLIGPGLLNISTRAETRVAGTSAYDYIHTSIVNPSAHVVEEYPDGLMPQVYNQLWTEEQINDIITYLYTLK